MADQLCASAARQEFGVTDKELQTLSCVYRRNPHYASAAPMRLYSRLDVQQLAESKREDAEWQQQHSEEIAAQRVKRLKQERDQALSFVNRLSTSATDTPVITDTALGLPIPIWSVAMSFLLSDAVRGVSTVSLDLNNLGRASKSSVSIAQEGFRLLASQCPVLPPDICWSTVLTNPLRLKVPELKQVARHLGVNVGGTKPLLCKRILAEFGVKGDGNNSYTSKIPPPVLRQVHHEGTTHTSCSPEGLLNMVRKMNRINPLLVIYSCTVRKLQKNLQTAGFTTEAVLREALTALEIQVQVQQMEKQNRVCITETCFQTAAKQCEHSQCGSCCTGCQRHRRRT